MSWQLASFLVLGLALAAGFGWFERSRPPARVVSLVAALAALAVVGRIVFAAIPTRPQPAICHGVQGPWEMKKFETSAATAPTAKPGAAPSV